MRLRYHGKHAAGHRRKLMALPVFGALAMTPVLVHSGDTLSGIAASHGASLHSVEAANPQISNPDLIYVGQKINLPGSSGVSPVVAQSVTGAFGHPYRCGDGDGDGWDKPCGATAPAAVPAGSPSRSAAPGAVASGSTVVPAWARCIVFRESSNNPKSVNSIPGYIGNGGGLFGDLTSTWNNYGGYHQPFQAPVSVQIQFNNQLSHNGANLKPWAADGCPGT